MASELRVDGQTYNLFKSVDGVSSIDTIAREVRITLSQQQNNQSVLGAQSFIEVYRDNVKDFTGYIDDISDSEDRSSHDIEFRARSMIADLLDSSVPENARNLEGVSNYAELVQLCVDGLGFGNTIKVIDEVGAKFADPEKIKAAETGDSCESFLTENARIVNVFLGDNGDGNIFIRKPSGKLKTIIQNVPGADNNNVKSSNVKIDYTQRFYKYTVHSNSSLASDDADVDSLNNEGSAFDNEIRKTRVLDITAKEPMTSEECKRAAEEEANIRRARSFSYSAEIAGFSANGELWEAGPNVKVIDTVKGISGIFLLNSVKWGFGDGGENVSCEISLPDKTTAQPSPTVSTDRIAVPSSTYKMQQNSQYIVQSGDTLSQIAVNFGVSLSSLVSSNPQIKNPDLIFPDQQIAIPAKNVGGTTT